MPRSLIVLSVIRNSASLCGNTTAGLFPNSLPMWESMANFIRKCGRVVCNSCSPHRIIIPHQYIVRPPGTEVAMSPSLLVDGLGTGYFDVNRMSGGERVRLCNPCVPDPNTAPPQSPSSPAASSSSRTAHQRSRSSFGETYGAVPATNRHGAIFAAGPANEYRYLTSRTRSITMVSNAYKPRK